MCYSSIRNKETQPQNEVGSEMVDTIGHDLKQMQVVTRKGEWL